MGISMVARRTLRVGATLVAVLATSALGAGAARAVTPYKDIASAGPLTHVYLGNELSCQIAYAGDAAFELFPSRNIPGDCGTLVALDGALYAPELHGPRELGRQRRRADHGVHPREPDAVSGTGTAAKPVPGDDGRHPRRQRRADHADRLLRHGRSPTAPTSRCRRGRRAEAPDPLRAGDCYLQESDVGSASRGPQRGRLLEEREQPAGRRSRSGIDHGRHNYLQAGSATSGGRSHADAAGQQCRCTESIDQAPASSWTLDVPAGGSKTVAHTHGSRRRDDRPNTGVAPPGSTGGGDRR